MRASSISSSVRGLSHFLAIPMLLAAFVGGCSGDATPEGTAGGADTAGETPAASGGSSSGSTPSEPAPAPAEPAPVDPTPDPAPKVTSGRVVAYAWLGNAGADKTTASASYSYSASGGAIEFVRSGTGNYEVTFTGLTLDKSVALVTPYASESRVCGWVGSVGSTVSVNCYDAAGSFADSRFMVTVVDEGEATGAHVLGYAHAHDMNADSYAPQASRSNNSLGGGAITASRTDVGTYSIQFAGLSDIENVQVTPYGSEAARCVVVNFALSGVNIRCFTAGGAPADTQYSVLLVGEKPGSTARIRAFAHAADAMTASYAPPLAWNETKGAATAYRSEKGSYSMAFAGLDLNPAGNVQVTSHGTGRRCNVGAWAGTTANVTCSNPDGSLQNNKYGIVVVQ